MKKFTEDNLKEIINMQFEIAGYDTNKINYDFIKENQTISGKDWYMYYTTTQENEDKFLEYLKKYLKGYAFPLFIEKEAQKLLLNYGLKIK